VVQVINMKTQHEISFYNGKKWSGLITVSYRVKNFAWRSKIDTICAFELIGTFESSFVCLWVWCKDRIIGSYLNDCWQLPRGALWLLWLEYKYIETNVVSMKVCLWWNHSSSWRWCQA
jgi:hypothetical protein